MDDATLAAVGARSLVAGVSVRGRATFAVQGGTAPDAVFYAASIRDPSPALVSDAGPGRAA